MILTTLPELCKKKIEIIKFLNQKGYNVKADINKFKVTDYQRLLKLFEGKDDEVMEAYIEVYNRIIPDDEKVI